MSEPEYDYPTCVTPAELAGIRVLQAIEQRRAAVHAQARASEDARKLKLSTRTCRLALLQRAAAKRRRKDTKRLLDTGRLVNAPDRES